MDQVYIRRHSTALSDMLAAVYAMSLAPLPTVGLLGGCLRRRLALHAVRLCAQSLSCSTKGILLPRGLLFAWHAGRMPLYSLYGRSTKSVV